MRDWRTERMFDGIVQSRCVSLAVERQGKTDCRECVFFLRYWTAAAAVADDNLTATIALPPQDPEWHQECLVGWRWPERPTQIHGTGPEFCGDFVERIL